MGSRIHPLNKLPLGCFASVTQFGGDDGNRTHDPLLAGQVLSQLSYTPLEGLPFFFKDLADP